MHCNEELDSQKNILMWDLIITMMEFCMKHIAKIIENLLSITDL